MGAQTCVYWQQKNCAKTIKKTVDTLFLLTYGSRSVIGPERVEAP